jgi:hypothetical protein
MKENKFLDGVSNIEPDVVERFVLVDNKLQRKASKAKSTGIWLRLVAIAACFILILGTIIVVPLLREDDLGIVPEQGTTDISGTSNFYESDPIQGEQGFYDDITISAALAQMIAVSGCEELISVKLQAIDMVDVYASDYADKLYDGKTYDEWWAEYEVYTNRMIEIEAQLKQGPNTELESEFNSIAEKAENLYEYMYKIQKEQKAESAAAEIAWLKSLGIEAEYKKGYFVFTATADEIKSIANGKCVYFIDVESSTQEPVEEMH